MKRKFNDIMLTLVVVFFAVAADIFIICQFKNYETGFLEIYGTQQDEYVKIILHQINRLDHEGTKENIKDIIASLDSKASRYWTLSKGDDLLFVKSVKETNRYKGFANGTYYTTETASKFRNSLKLNQVEHQIIYLDQERFIASGVIFSWQGEQYQTCLLTYDKAILEDNILLECKNAIIIIFSIILALFIILSMIMSRKINKQSSYIKKQQEHIIWQNQQINLLDERLKREYAFSASRHVFRNIVLDEFLDTLDKKNASPLHFAIFEIKSTEARDKFFEYMQVVLDNQVLRFSMDERIVVLIFIKYKKNISDRIIASLENGKVHALADLYCKDNKKSYKEQFYKFWKGVKINEERKTVS